MINQDAPNFSETISTFIKMMDDAKKDFDWNNAELKRMDDLTQDYLHSLELDGLGYKERARLATKLAECRRKRREHKDMVLCLEPLVSFIESDKGKTTLNLMREALGKTRKIEKYMENRKYFRRVLDAEKQGGNV